MPTYDKTFQAKVWPIIKEVMDTYVASVFSGRLSKDVAASLSTFPFGIYQSQDGGGSNNDYISTNGWKGLITIRCIDLTSTGADAKALQVAQALQNITHATYDINVHIREPKSFPVDKVTQGSVYTSALLVDMVIHPK
jgi:hypothetical protein